VKAWYCPAWNGDHRLEADGDGSKLIVHEPTVGEVEILGRFLGFARGKGWTEAEELPKARTRPIKLSAKVAEAGLELARLHGAKRAGQTITAVRFEGGKVEVATLADAPASAELATKAAEDKEAKAVTSKRATPCCPSCVPGAIGPASEVLLSFLTPQQHRDWARHRVLEVEGGTTGHRYLLSHRHGKDARRWTRIGYDATDGFVMHFYDWSVPPEEEVLAAKLVLEHRESWLRNEATCFASGGLARQVQKNPFGGLGDGTETSGLFRAFGDWAGFVAKTALGSRTKPLASPPVAVRR
jgi:hypothetical protein